MRALLTGIFMTALAVAVAGERAEAARGAVVEIDQISLLASPDAGSAVITRLARGTPLVASNYPTLGYYKIRTPQGEVGWVSASALVLEKLSKSASEEVIKDSVLEAVSPKLAKEQASVDQEGGTNDAYSFYRRRSDVERRGKRRSARFRALGGADFFNPAELSELAGIEGLSTGYYFGGEMYFFFRPEAAVGLRAESIGKSALMQTGSGDAIEFSLSSLPVSLGFHYELVNSGAVIAHLTLLAGAGLNTVLTVSKVPAGQPTKITASPFTGTFKLDLAWQLGGSVASFFEIGYRSLRTSALSPSAEGDGIDLFKVNGKVSPVRLDLSGVFLGAGLSFPF